MNQHSTQFEATDGGLVLTNAILLYRSPRHGSPYASSREGEEAFASMHAVEQSANGPTIGAGTPLTRAHLRRWTAALGKSAAPEILSAHVLVAHPDVIAWWIPEQVRPAYFALNNPPAGLKALAEKVIRPVPYPAHVFVATRRGLGVYALPENKRPTADTALLYSPILNVFVEGGLCWGNIPRPKALTLAAIPDFERAVFESWSTHPNPGQERTISGKGGLVRLWDNLATSKAKRFPTKRLKPFAGGQRRDTSAPLITLGQIIARSVKQ